VLEAPETQGKGLLIELLAGLTVGYAEWHVPLGFDPAKRFVEADALGQGEDLDRIRAADPNEEEDWDPSRQALWMRDSYQAALQRGGTFQRMIQDAD
jgi:hypothetical protein